MYGYQLDTTTQFAEIHPTQCPSTRTTADQLSPTAPRPFPPYRRHHHQPLSVCPVNRRREIWHGPLFAPFLPIPTGSLIRRCPASIRRRCRWPRASAASSGVTHRQITRRMDAGAAGDERRPAGALIGVWSNTPIIHRSPRRETDRPPPPKHSNVPLSELHRSAHVPDPVLGNGAAV